MFCRRLVVGQTRIRSVRAIPQVSITHLQTRHFNFIKKNPLKQTSESDKKADGDEKIKQEKSQGTLANTGSNIPPLKPRWFYATDIPITMPKEYKYVKKEDPKKFTPFTEFDSDRIEKRFQKLEKSQNENIDAEQFKIPVNEDYLFEVDLKDRKMYPVYWDGAVYEIRRGLWYNSDGHPLREELSKELEQGYAKLRPFEKKLKNPKSSKEVNVENEEGQRDIYELKGFKEGKLVVYSEDKTAYILNELYGGKLQLGYLKGLQNGPALGASRMTRGYTKDTDSANKSNDDKSGILSLSSMFELELSQMFGEKTKTATKESSSVNAKEAMKIEIEQDYNNPEHEDGTTAAGREVDHLIFCIHGIGQSLGTKFQGVNFIHTVNILRKNIKKVYGENKDFQKLLNNDKNCRIQVLPISWRHKIDFSTHEPFKDLDDEGNYRLPTLNDITVDEMKPFRNLIGSVLLDVLLYYEPRFFNQILDEVTQQANHLYRLFKERNPSFNGKISIIGHSLGSAIGFDLLSFQPKELRSKDDPKRTPKDFDFKVDNYFALGSPIGVFNLLKFKNIGSSKLNGESTKTVSVPRCDNLYNVFHPCDPVGYRIEPLISPEFKKFQPESVPFLIEDFNKQLASWAELSENIRGKFIGTAADAWSNVTSNVGAKQVEKLLKTTSKNIPDAISEDKKPEDENLKLESVKLTDKQLEKLAALNYNGRVDYALQQGYFDLTIISSISAHISYFEDENVAGFILKEILAKHETVKEKTAKILVEKKEKN